MTDDTLDPREGPPLPPNREVERPHDAGGSGPRAHTALRRPRRANTHPPPPPPPIVLTGPPFHCEATPVPQQETRRHQRNTKQYRDPVDEMADAVSAPSPQRW